MDVVTALDETLPGEFAIIAQWLGGSGHSFHVWQEYDTYFVGQQLEYGRAIFGWGQTLSEATERAITYIEG
jgi:hypothetical protein